MKILLAGIVMVLTGVGVWFLLEHQAARDSSLILNDGTPHSGPVAERLGKPSAQSPDQPFEIDLDRIYDKGYAAEPEIQNLAESYNISPECLLALAKYRFDQVPLEPGICPKPAENSESLALSIPEDHPYHRYSDQQLETLAETSPEAAVILARRVESDEESREVYERAVALSGISSPLLEWMTARNTGGLNYDYGQLDVAAAKVGYEIFLIAAAFDGKRDPIVDTYEVELRKEGVDLAQIEAHALQEVQELYAQRYELTGRN